MKLVKVIAIAAVLTSCANDDDHAGAFDSGIQEGCECGTVTDYDVRNVGNGVAYYLDYRRDCDNKVVEVQTTREAYYEFNTGDKICW